MTDRPVLVDSAELRRFTAALFCAAGMLRADADTVAACLVQTNLWGIDSHGVLRAPIYLERLRSGAMNPRPDVRVVGGRAGASVVDGDAGPGFLAGLEGMARATESARDHGIGVCAVRNSNHFGAAGLYARVALEQGMIGVAMTNVMPNMVALGGSRPVVGNNPLAIAVPTTRPFPFVLDISLSAVAGGKLLLASSKGEKIPTDWATDAHGRPTDDPDEAFEGFLLPMAGIKGLGLAYAVDILCGVLGGGAFGWDVKSMYKHKGEPSQTAHLLLAVDIEAFMERGEFDRRIELLCSAIKASPVWDEAAEMLLPGEIEHGTEERRRREGIPLPATLYADLLRIGDELKAKPLSALQAPS